MLVKRFFIAVIAIIFTALVVSCSTFSENNNYPSSSSSSTNGTSSSVSSSVSSTNGTSSSVSSSSSSSSINGTSSSSSSSSSTSSSSIAPVQYTIWFQVNGPYAIPPAGKFNWLTNNNVPAHITTQTLTVNSNDSLVIIWYNTGYTNQIKLYSMADYAHPILYPGSVTNSAGTNITITNISTNYIVGITTN